MAEQTVTVYRMYKYRLYRCDKKDKKLRHNIFVASIIWNHFIALQRRYYRLTGKYIPLKQMNNHVLKLRRLVHFRLWQDLHSQVCQDVCRRVDDGYQRFFHKLAKHPPKFKKARKYRSFTFPQSGYQVTRNTVTMAGVRYKFVKHCDIGGQIKTLTVKRDAIGRLWLVLSVVETLAIPESSTGQIGGFDFGLKDFLTDEEGRRYASPQFYAQGLRQTKQLHRRLSRKVEGSNPWMQARRALARHAAQMANQRRDHHYKLAHQICATRDMLCFEDLNLAGLKARWGQKVSDLGFGHFLDILEWVAFKQGKTVVKIGRFQPTTQVCSGCGQRHVLALKDRTLHCDCGLTIDRDHNAAINIKTIGASMDCQSGRKPKVSLRHRVDGRRPRL